MASNIELELRAEINSRQRERLIAYLRGQKAFVTLTRRLSVIFLKKADGRELDIRVRITNGQAEIAVKKGGFHAHDRTEFTRPIAIGQFIGMVRVFEQLFRRIKVAERETENYRFGKGIFIAVVRAGPISYVEIEKMTNRTNFQRDHRLLIGLSKNLGLEIIRSRKEFDELCQRLTKTVDWTFDKSTQHHAKLRRLLRRYSRNFRPT